jgi:MoaD family protein
MRIKIKIIPPLSHLASRKDDVIELSEGANVRDALSLLVMKYGKKFEEYVLNTETKEVHGHIQVMVNKRNMGSLNGLETTLNGGDIIRIFPPVSGG